MRGAATLVALGLVVGCGGPTVVGDPLAEPAPGDAPGVALEPMSADGEARFVGEWVLDQPFHAAYEATRYRFNADGSLERLEAYPQDFDVGHATIVDESACTPDDDPYFCTVRTRCTFADRWTAPTADTLVVSATCDDGQARDLELRFVTDASSNSGPGASVEVVRIGDVTEGTLRDSFVWSWVRCADAEGTVLSESWVCEAPWPWP